jgi:hypothetical protein
MALAQGLADDVRYADMVLLADLALHADHAMLHDARDVVPGVIELVEAHRTGTPSTEEVRSLTFDVTERRYQLLLGLRRHRDWTAIRPRALDAAIDGLRRSFRVVVADVESDFEGEDECGSLDIEERNLLARTSVREADVVVAVGRPGMQGMHALLRVVRDLVGAGVAAARVLPVINGAPKGPKARAELARTMGDLLEHGRHAVLFASPIFVPERRRLDELLRDTARLPGQMTGPLGGAVRALFERPSEDEVTADGPAPLVPGSLGTLTEELG